MSIPDYQALMLPVLKASSGGEVRISDVRAEVGKQLGLTPDDYALRLPSDRQGVFENRVHWARFYLGKAGLVEATRRGCFRVTSRGDEALRSNLVKIDNQYLKRFQEFRDFTEESRQDGASERQAIEPEITIQTETPDAIMRAAHKQIDASLAQDILDRIGASSPEFFERLLVRLLVTMGYGGSAADAGRAIGRSGDDGVDGVIDQDALGLDRVYVQAKRYKKGNNIGSGAIRDFFGSLDRHKAAKGLFVTTSSFSPAARETAEFLSKRIVLIDGDQLAVLMIRYNVGCRTEHTLLIRKLDEDFFE